MYLEISVLTIIFSSVESGEDPVMQVMLRSIQDPELAPIYEGLPDLGCVLDDCDRHVLLNIVFLFLESIDQSTNMLMSAQLEWVSLHSKTYRVALEATIFRVLQSLLPKCLLNSLHSRLLRALLFTKSGFFVNPARAAPDVFVAEYGRLKIKEPSSVAVCIMTGIVTDCAIVSEGCTGGPDNEKTVHKISLAPFHQEFRHDTTMWGKILNFNSLSCAISTEGLSFTTKPRTLSAPIFSSPCMSHPVSGFCCFLISFV